MEDDTTARLRGFWNTRYEGSELAYGRWPNGFLVDAWQRFGPLPPGAPVLCLADGEGRNGVWLAQQGAAVTSVDIADAGVRKAQALAAEAGVALQALAGDVTTFDLQPGAWAAIVSIFLHLPADARRALHRRCFAALQPGGLFVFEAYGPGQLAWGTGGPKEAALLPSLQDVEADFPAEAIVHRFAGRREVQEGRLHTGTGEVVQLVSRRPSGASAA